MGFSTVLGLKVAGSPAILLACAGDQCPGRVSGASDLSSCCSRFGERSLPLLFCVFSTSDLATPFSFPTFLPLTSLPLSLSTRKATCCGFQTHLNTIFTKRNVLIICLIAPAFPLLCSLSEGIAFSSCLAVWLPHRPRWLEALASVEDWGVRGGEPGSFSSSLSVEWFLWPWLLLFHGSSCFQLGPSSVVSASARNRPSVLLTPLWSAHLPRSDDTSVPLQPRE